MPTALIVEDEPEANNLLALLVQLRGYQTTSALTGRDALESLRHARPDVVLLDLMLPDTDGFELCQTLKSRPETCLIPVIIVSARMAEESRARSLQVGALGFVPKPYTPDQIFQALAAADSWSRDLAGRGRHGQIQLDADEDEFARGVASLKCLLMARTPLGNQSASRIVAALKSIRDDVRKLASRHATDHVATVYYVLGEDRLTLTIRDEGGWFGGEAIKDRTAQLDSELNQVFDEAGTCESGRDAILTKHFDPPTADPNSIG